MGDLFPVSIGTTEGPRVLPTPASLGTRSTQINESPVLPAALPQAPETTVQVGHSEGRAGAPVQDSRVSQ